MISRHVVHVGRLDRRLKVLERVFDAGSVGLPRIVDHHHHVAVIVDLQPFDDHGMVCLIAEQVEEVGKRPVIVPETVGVDPHHHLMPGRKIVDQMRPVVPLVTGDAVMFEQSTQITETRAVVSEPTMGGGVVDEPSLRERLSRLWIAQMKLMENHLLRDDRAREAGCLVRKAVPVRRADMQRVGLIVRVRVRLGRTEQRSERAASVSCSTAKFTTADAAPCNAAGTSASSNPPCS